MAKKKSQQSRLPMIFSLTIVVLFFSVLSAAYTRGNDLMLFENNKAPFANSPSYGSGVTEKDNQEIKESYKEKMQNARVYRVSIKNIFDNNLSAMNINSVLSKSFPEEHNTLFAESNYGIRGSKSVFNLLTTAKLEQNQEISNDDYEIKVLLEDPSIKPYLLDSKYCEVDEDCSKENSFCSVGSYNKYSPLTAAYGCVAVQSIEGYTMEQVKKLASHCPIGDPSGIPDYRASFTKAECVSNKCTAVDMKIICVE